MQFVDEATIEVTAGRGGDGIVSFRRESKVPRGGPDGGEGGRGGDVVLVGDGNARTLLDHRYRRFYKAPSGGRGGPANRTGASGADLEIRLPLGTVVTDGETGEVLADLQRDGERVVVARGGRGGHGNAHFKTPSRKAPRFATEGKDGEAHTLRLSLKLMADVGLVGLPNAGKSTFLRAVSASQAEVAAYPFTTLTPNLGVVSVDGRSFVMADIPGLIEGAHAGLGLGIQFLKHIERTRVLLHLLALGPDSTDPLEAYDVVTRELRAHDEALATRHRLVVLNKVDLVDDPYEVELWREAFAERGVSLLTASGRSGEGVREVLRAVAAELEAEDEPAPTAPWSPLDP